MSLAASGRVMLRAPLQRWVLELPASAITRLQARRVRDAVSYAYAHVPFYGEAMRRAGLSPADIRSGADLARLPVIERDQLQADPERFVAQGVSRKGWVTLATGGSTGSPVRVLRDARSVLDTSIHAQRSRSLLARAVGSFRWNEAVFSPSAGSGITLAEAFRSSSLLKPELRGARRAFSLFEPVSAHIDGLESFRPDVYAGYGSYVDAMLTHAAATGRPRHLPKAVTYAADPMSDECRAWAAEHGIQVLSTYQAVESGQVGFECSRHDGFHVNADFCPARVEDGQVITSDLTNRATVLLNYRLGDVARELPPCNCGIQLPKLSFLEGRTADWLRGPSGESLHPQTAKVLLRQKSEVLRYQIVQVERGRFEVSLVVREDCEREGLSTRLQEEFTRAFEAGVEVRFVDELPRTRAGKVRPVVSLVD